MSAKIKRYFFTGLFLVFALVGTVLLVRWRTTHEVSQAAVPLKQKGPANAPVSMIIYSDFQCPACRNAREPIESLRKKFPEQLKIQFRHFPLEGNHRWALLAAQFSECAAKEGKFWPYHDRLYDEQPAWSQSAEPLPLFIGYAREAGLNLTRLEACVTSEEVVKTIRNERKEGERSGVRSTPTIFIGKKMVVGGQQLQEQGEKIVNEALKK